MSARITARRVATVASAVTACLAVLAGASPAYAGDEYGDCSATAGEHFVNVTISADTTQTLWSRLVRNGGDRDAEFSVTLAESKTGHSRVVGSYEASTDAKFKILKVGIEAKIKSGLTVDLQQVWSTSSIETFKATIPPGGALDVMFKQVLVQAKGDVVRRYTNCKEEPIAEDVAVSAAAYRAMWDSEPVPAGGSGSGGDVGSGTVDTDSTVDSAFAVADPLAAVSDATDVSPDTESAGELPATTCADVTKDAEYAAWAVDEGTEATVFIDPPKVETALVDSTAPASSTYSSAESAADPCGAVVTGTTTVFAALPHLVTP